MGDGTCPGCDTNHHHRHRYTPLQKVRYAPGCLQVQHEHCRWWHLHDPASALQVWGAQVGSPSGSQGGERSLPGTAEQLYKDCRVGYVEGN